MVLDFISAGLESYMQNCRGCDTLLDYGVNTKFSSKHLSHICSGCGEIVR